MKTKSTLLAGLAGLLLAATAAVAGPDTWRRPEPPKPKAACCAACLPGGACCEVRHGYYTPASGRGVIRTTKVLCKTSCAMPKSARDCCTTGCVR